MLYITCTSEIRSNNNKKHMMQIKAAAAIIAQQRIACIAYNIYIYSTTSLSSMMRQLASRASQASACAPENSRNYTYVHDAIYASVLFTCTNSTSLRNTHATYMHVCIYLITLAIHNNQRLNDLINNIALIISIIYTHVVYARAHYYYYAMHSRPPPASRIDRIIILNI